jgi:hypothetical protein
MLVIVSSIHPQSSDPTKSIRKTSRLSQSLSTSVSTQNSLVSAPAHSVGLEIEHDVKPGDTIDRIADRHIARIHGNERPFFHHFKVRAI